ncbi:MAG: lmo0937 family membrane protein [Candidatus Acidiferrales bacterium]
MRFVFLGLALIFVLIWAFAFVAFHVAGFLIHIFLILAVVFFVVHLLRPRRAP